MYFEYSKSAQISSFIIATLYSLAFSVISSVIVSFIIPSASATETPLM